MYEEFLQEVFETGLFDPRFRVNRGFKFCKQIGGREAYIKVYQDCSIGWFVYNNDTSLTMAPIIYSLPPFRINYYFI